MLSIIIPVYNEETSIKPLADELLLVLARIGRKFELIFINDGSTDNSQKNIEELCKRHPQSIKKIQFRKNSGKAAALQAGFNLAKGDIIITLDGDLQDNPQELPRFIKKIEEGFDLVSGWKQNRKDPVTKNLASKLFNFVTGKVTKIKLHDFNSGFKAYRAEAVKTLNLYGELHRYIPVLVAAQGFKITEIPIEHRKRQFGKSKYGSIRFINGFFDLLTVLFITKFNKQPLHMFGYIGLVFFTAGFAGGIYLSILKFLFKAAIGNRPLLLLSVMLMIMGVQIIITGLIGEQITASLTSRKTDHFIKKIK